MTQTHTAKIGQIWVSWLQAMLVMLYHIASSSHFMQKAPEIGAAGGALVLARWDLLFGMCEVVGLSILGESGGSR